MHELFKVAGYENYEKMEICKPYVPEVPVEILSWNERTKKTEYKKVKSLFYKGLSKGYEVYDEEKGYLFKVTADHSFLAAPGFNRDEEARWYPARELGPRFLGVGSDGSYLEIELVPVETPFPVLDVEVEDNHCYFTNGVVSHNSFGGTAKVFANGLKYLNPYLSNTGTSMIVINQERDNIGCVAPSTEVMWDFM
jgi:hypothetical protein